MLVRVWKQCTPLTNYAPRVSYPGQDGATIWPRSIISRSNLLAINSGIDNDSWNEAPARDCTMHTVLRVAANALLNIPAMRLRSCLRFELLGIFHDSIQDVCEFLITWSRVAGNRSDSCDYLVAMFAPFVWWTPIKIFCTALISFCLIVCCRLLLEQFRSD